MTTIARKLATWMKLTSSPENPQSHIIYDTPLGIQVGSQKLNRNHGAFADTTALDAFLLSKGLTAGDGDEALIGESGSYALYRHLNGSWSASAGGGGSVTVNNTLTSTSTTSALSAAQGKVLQDTKAPRGGPGAALGATYTAVDADDGKIWPTPVDCAVTVNAGLIAGFGQGFSGAGVVSFVAGAGVTFPADYDKRTEGATNPVCSLVNIGLNTYEIWGTKQ